MKVVVFTVALSILGSCAYSQTKRNDYCVRTKTISSAKIQTIFPFNMADKIEVVSYKGVYKVYGEDSILLHTIPKRDGNVDLNQLFEVKQLDSKLRNELTDILMNYNYDPKFGESVESIVVFCYDPRNAILFIDKSEKVIAYIEICFECSQFEIDPKDLKVGDFCFEKFRMINEFFKKAGITYGLSETRH